MFFLKRGVYQHHKMFRGLLFMIVIWSVTGFNIQITPVKHFKEDDPLFGQTIIQSTDGVFVPSPKNGALFRCTLQDECIEVNSDDEKPKGLRPVVSVSSLTSEEEQCIMMCNQVRIKKSVTEDLNGDCKLMNPSGRVTGKPNPVALVNNNNNNHYQGARTGQDQRKMRRDAQPDGDTKDRDYDVNVPLPSKSALLSPATNQMENKKFNSNNNNNNHYRGGRIEEVKRRMRRDAQLDSDTDEDEDEDDAGTEIAFVLDGSGSIQHDDFRRAKDFIYNVMFNVWNTCFDCNFAIVQYGSKIRTELSLLDNDNGAKTLQKVKEIQQIYNLTKTASAIHHVLTDIFIPENGSKIDSKKIIIVLSDGEILGDNMILSDVLNMPQMKGVTRYSIGVGDGILKKPKAIQEMTDIADRGKFFNVSNYAALDDILSSLQQSLIGIEGTQQGAGFQFQLAETGFSTHLMQDVTTFEISTTLYISGAPRYNLTGGVFIFNGSEKYVLQGDQVGSYFGSVLCALDIDKDEYTDYLLVGAPHFHLNGEEGKVLVYKLNQQDRFESVSRELKGDEGQTFARFGAAIASIGDIDGNKFNDVAVGAPLETDSSGSIYIYNGFKHGLNFSQKISPSDFGMKLVHFGLSVTGGPAMASNKASIAVGSQGGVIVFETIPVIVIKPDIIITPDVIPLNQQMIEISSTFDIMYHICFTVINGKLQIQLPIKYQIALDSGVNKKRLTVDGRDLLENTFTLTPDVECAPVINLKYLGCFDCFSPIQIKLNFSLDLHSNEAPIRILDAFTPTEVVKEISFKKDCKVTDCKPNITLSDSKISETSIIIGETQSLSINFNLTNTEDPSYMTTLTLTFPSILSQKKIEGATCPVKNDNQIQCNLQHPVFKRGAQTNLFISWQLNDIKSDLKNSEIIANLTSQNRGSKILDSKIYAFAVKYSLPIQLTGSADPSRLSIEEGKEGKTQKIQFVFQFAGENKYGATVGVVVTITKDTFKTGLDIISVTPHEECVFSENTKAEGSYVINCTMTKLQKIIIDANVLIHDVQEKSNKITAVGTYSFDETVYTAKDTLRTIPVEVIITKLRVTTSKGPIIGGSIGGFLLLFIIIIILIKCGFFRRRRKVDQAQSPN
ncbi:integrin alpha-E-like [Sinocyclocheilus rhinocerous]|uniref:integrin alpha-E-like n=1 Tax=Sinocyclocheilus rhinocerous TaxID=307959 RepID=UPI0007BAA350|nr:PREDICTED: integrin alpha-E-like [Sinocyclocheilus rhinocerous]